jgi:hypothetical protein
MAKNLFLPVAIQTTQIETVGVTAQQISMTMADTETAGILSIVLAAKDDAGQWRDDVPPVVVHKVDDLESETPSKRFAASMFQQLIFTAIVADSPLHQAMGVAGLSVWDAAKVILAGEVMPDAK